jgi:hypothetical protein
VRLLSDAHSLLLDGVRGSGKQPGALRRSQNWIGGTRPGNAVFVPPPAERVAGLLADMEHFIHGTPASALPPLVKIALVHAQFETIHPFLDGNGRIGRLLIGALLEHWALLPEPLLYLSGYLKQHQAEYYRRLSNIRTEGDWEGWVQLLFRRRDHRRKRCRARCRRHRQPGDVATAVLQDPEDQPVHDGCDQVVDHLLQSGRAVATGAGPGRSSSALRLAAVAQAIGLFAAGGQRCRGFEQGSVAGLATGGDQFARPGGQVLAQVAGVGQRPVRVEPVHGGLRQQAGNIAPAPVDAGGADARALGHGRHGDLFAALFGHQLLQRGAHQRLHQRTAAAGSFAGSCSEELLSCGHAGL